MSGTDAVRQSTYQSGGQREFVGFVWTDNWLEQTGMLVEAHDVSEAVEIVRSFNPDWHVSLWNEEDAGRAR
jgi:hypothetical protein